MIALTSKNIRRVASRIYKDKQRFLAFNCYHVPQPKEFLRRTQRKRLRGALRTSIWDTSTRRRRYATEELACCDRRNRSYRPCHNILLVHAVYRAEVKRPGRF